MSVTAFFKIARFFVSGGLATATNLGVLYILVHVCGLWYLAASVIGFLAGFTVSFTLQKFWTFRDNRTDILRKQLVVYLLIIVVNLGLNTALVFCFVEMVLLEPVIAQTLASLIIAIESFFAYKILVFGDRKEPVVGLSERK